MFLFLFSALSGGYKLPTVVKHAGSLGCMGEVISKAKTGLWESYLKCTAGRAVLSRVWPRNDTLGGEQGPKAALAYSYAYLFYCYVISSYIQFFSTLYVFNTACRAC